MKNTFNYLLINFVIIEIILKNYQNCEDNI